ncbi:MAG: metallophosphoesterase family protein [Anaerolineales bacterium]|nr:metallophosphoesterase family protein [Anaerolineales bacterium]
MTSIGLISDTHYQDRLFALPDKLAQVWTGVSLILHAGDVGDLSLLDALSAIAPVIAVSGNDEPEAVKQQLPLTAVVTVDGRRLLVTHSHFTDAAEERASRREQSWGPKFDRLAELAQGAGARYVIYGHTHIPLLVEHQGVTLFNPGALAAPSYFTRPKRLLVGRLDFRGQNAKLDHYDLATGRSADLAKFNPRLEFGFTLQQFQSSIVEPSLLADIDRLRSLKFEQPRGVVQALVPLYRRCLTENQPMRRKDLLAALEGSAEVAAADRAAALGLLTHAADETIVSDHQA